MREYYFLFGIALVYLIFALIQDIKKREVANWLSFSLIGFAFFYRYFYFVYNDDLNFFLLGILGFALFFVLGMGLYYLRAFGGGDVKLLMGLGMTLPYTNYLNLILYSLIFILLVFTIGAIYSLIYSIFIAIFNREKFVYNFKKNVINRRSWIIFIVSLLALIILSLLETISLGILLFVLIILIYLLFVYLKAIDLCMYKLYHWDKLSEGDWVDDDIMVGDRVIKHSVHGLSLKDIEFLRKSKRRVLVKEGIPFMPAILIAFMVFFALFFLFDFVQFLLALF